MRPPALTCRTSCPWSLVIVAALAGPAAAEPDQPTAPTAPTASVARFDVGARVGGWGYRREGDPTPVDGWRAGRMNGVGVFGSRALNRRAFLEFGLDLYASDNTLLGSPTTDVPADRISGMTSAALGARLPITPWLRGFVQVGAGVELTRVSVAYGSQRIRDRRVFPDGFLGAGLDLEVADGIYLGASFRMLVMGTFNYDRQRLDMSAGWVTTPTADEVFDATAGLAAQGQFFLRHEL